MRPRSAAYPALCLPELRSELHIDERDPGQLESRPRFIRADHRLVFVCDVRLVQGRRTLTSANCQPPTANLVNRSSAPPKTPPAGSPPSPPASSDAFLPSASPGACVCG